MDLPFIVPKVVMTCEGKSYTLNNEGKIVTLFHFIDGKNASQVTKTSDGSFGRKTAELSKVLCNVQLESPPVYPPYYELNIAHPSCSIEKSISFCNNLTENQEYSDAALEIKELGDYLQAFLNKLDYLRNLPHQLIHGDLNSSNVLFDNDGAILAILDFEFVTWDLRAMEVAVSLTDIVNPDEPESVTWERVEEFLEGFVKVLKLSEDEVKAIPDLLILRRLDVFIHFLSRYFEGVNGSDIVKEQAIHAYKLCNWMKENRNALESKLVKIST